MIDAGAEGIQCLRDFGKCRQIGVEDFAAHQLGEGVNLLVELLQFFLGCQTVAADCLQADDETLVIHARNRFGNLEAVVHGAADDLETVAVGQAGQGVQLLRFREGDVGEVVEARVKPRQFDLRQFVQADQRLVGGGRQVDRLVAGGLGGDFVVQPDDGMLYRLVGKVVFNRQLDIGFDGGRFGEFGFGGEDFVLFLQIAQRGFLGFVRFFDEQAFAAGFFTVAHMAGFTVQERVFVGVAELLAHLFAVLVFLVHIVGDDGKDDCQA